MDELEGQRTHRQQQRKTGHVTLGMWMPWQLQGYAEAKGHLRIVLHSPKETKSLRHMTNIMLINNFIS